MSKTGYFYRLGKCGKQGFTLIELAMVILLIALISTIISTKFEAVSVWRSKGEVRRFAHSWQFVFNEAQRSREAYRLLINIDEGSYFAQWEVPEPPGSIVSNVDYVEHFRLDSEKKRRAEKKARERESLEKSFASYDARQSAPLENLYFANLFRDPHTGFSLMPPLNAPKLGKIQEFSERVRIRDVVTAQGKVTSGEVMIRFSPQGSSSFAVVHFEIADSIFTVFLSPSTGTVKISEEDLDIKI